MRQYDKNKNGVLEREEASQLREGLREADRNRDGVVTRDELSAQLLEYSQRRGGGGGPGSDRGRGSGPGGGKDGDSRKSYRFLTAQERLPGGLPDWFLNSDANHDGQVSMAEYAKDWSDVIVGKFIAYDLNNDGIITPTECLAVEKPRKK